MYKNEGIMLACHICMLREAPHSYYPISSSIYVAHFIFIVTSSSGPNSLANACALYGVQYNTRVAVISLNHPKEEKDETFVSTSKSLFRFRIH